MILNEKSVSLRAINIREIVLTSILLISGLTDGVRRLSLGSMTALAAVTIVASLGSALLLLFSSQIPKRMALTSGIYLTFLGYSCVRDLD